MGRYSYSNRAEADGLKKIETSFLKKHGYLNGFKAGSIVWTNQHSGNKNDIGISVWSDGDNPLLHIYYTQTDRDTGDKKDFSYDIPLTTTPCHYGGKRHWFTCPMYKSGVYCGRRVGVLYKNGDYFACRHCNNLTYASRNVSGSFRKYGNVTIPDVDKARENVKRTHYNGKPTRKYRRYLKMEDNLENAFIGMAMLLGNKEKKL